MEGYHFNTDVKEGSGTHFSGLIEKGSFFFISGKVSMSFFEGKGLMSYDTNS